MAKKRGWTMKGAAEACRAQAKNLLALLGEEVYKELLCETERM